MSVTRIAGVGTVTIAAVLLLTGAGCAKKDAATNGTVNQNTNAAAVTNVNSTSNQNVNQSATTNTTTNSTTNTSANQNTNQGAATNTTTNTSANQSTNESLAANTNEARPETKEFSITAQRWQFTPATITVNEGDTVKLTITSVDVTHGFSLPTFGVNETLNPNSPVTVEFTADRTGSFTWSCTVFCGSGHSGMSGTLVVQ